MKALIASGGRGTRLRPITHTRNKHLIPIANKPILHYAIEAVASAGIRDVVVLNVNDLAHALRPVVLPGETLRVTIVKDGKEPGQGVGYLADGTMIVVEQARGFSGRTIDVVVTSAIQTAAGKMFFAKPAE